MIVVVTAEPEADTRVRLEDPDDCGAFHVRAEGADRTRLAAALEGHDIGRTEGDDAFVDPAAIRRLAGSDVAADWGARFEGMLGYAKAKGWLDERGWVQAHCEGVLPDRNEE